MKKNLLLVSLLAFIITLAACKKDYIKPESNSDVSWEKNHKIKKDKCKPGKTECPANPYAVGMVVVPQGYQVGNYVFDISVYYINPNPLSDTCGLVFTIGGKTYITNNQLVMADINNLGTMSGTIALLENSFDAVTKGFHIHQRCDCDSSYFNSGYHPTTTTLPESVAVMTDKFSIVEKIGGRIYYATSKEMLGKMLAMKVSDTKSSF